MLKITLHDYPKALTFKLEGQLAGAWVAELRQCWKTASSIRNGRPLVVDLAGVTFVDAGGRKLLEDFVRERAEFLAHGPMLHALVREITGGAQDGQEPAVASSTRGGVAAHFRTS
ncbi:MAG: hypothetical protein NTY38_02490 [Acidobacteria bacterium]|nr:hypothetical protein [Acidobacteriota bacterium]